MNRLNEFSLSGDHYLADHSTLSADERTRIEQAAAAYRDRGAVKIADLQAALDKARKPVEDKVGEINRNNVESITPSRVSSMPEGALNTLTQHDVLDLLAYLIGR